MLALAFRISAVLAAALFVIAVALCGYFALTSPIAFQKSVVIEFLDRSQYEQPKPRSYVDIRAVLEPIPYKGGMVYEVHPRQKYLRTLQEGYGNCSNLAFGLAYFLRDQNVAYQIVYILPPEDFLKGGGHMVVNMPFALDGAREYGIVDVLEGGLPKSDGKFVDLELLEKGSLTKPSILPMNSAKDDQSKYYGEFLDSSVIGIATSDEINAYFSFIEMIYVPLGRPRVEKMLYDSLAIVFGYYPTLCVAKEDAADLFAGHESTRFLAMVLLAAVRAFLALVVLLTAAKMLMTARNLLHKSARR